MHVDAGGSGYRFVASDSGIFCYDASFLGSMGGHPLNKTGHGRRRKVMSSLADAFRAAVRRPRHSPTIAASVFGAWRQ
jgi:N-acetylglucosamine kinase-like BadF-type ATPase